MTATDTPAVIVTDEGFKPDNFNGQFASEPASNAGGLDLASDVDPYNLPDIGEVQLIRVDFPSFADGRGFTIARALRRQGYTGRLRAKGHVLADQYAMARRSGFDEVEISADLAARQPEQDWLFRADWQDNDHRARLRRA